MKQVVAKNVRFVVKKQQPGDFITVTGSEKIFGYPSDQSEGRFGNLAINKAPPVVNLIGQFIIGLISARQFVLEFLNARRTVLSRCFLQNQRPSTNQ